MTRSELRAARERIAGCFARSALAEMDRTALAKGFEAPLLPSLTIAADFRRMAARVVRGMSDRTVEELSGAEDEVLIKVFADIARKSCAEEMPS